MGVSLDGIDVELVENADLRLPRRLPPPPAAIGGPPGAPGRPHHLAGSVCPAARNRLADPQAEPLEQLGDALELQVMAVPRAQRGQLIRVSIDRAAHVRQLFEETLEAGRGNDLEDPARLVARVRERVPLVARLEDQVARAGLDDLVAEQRAHAAFQDEGVLVLARVQVQRRRERPRRHRMLDEREGVPRLRPVDHERTPIDPTKPSFASLGPTIFTAVALSRRPVTPAGVLGPRPLDRPTAGPEPLARDRRPERAPRDRSA